VRGNSPCQVFASARPTQARRPRRTRRAGARGAPQAPIGPHRALISISSAPGFSGPVPISSSPMQCRLQARPPVKVIREVNGASSASQWTRIRAEPRRVGLQSGRPHFATFIRVETGFIQNYHKGGLGRAKCSLINSGQDREI
jgi:hypothetical protein